jgi:hypothetical protein
VQAEDCDERRSPPENFGAAQPEGERRRRVKTGRHCQAQSNGELLAGACGREYMQRHPDGHTGGHGIGIDRTTIEDTRRDEHQSRTYIKQQRHRDVRDGRRQDSMERQQKNATPPAATRHCPPKGGPRRAFLRPIDQHEHAARQRDQPTREGQR